MHWLVDILYPDVETSSKYHAQSFGYLSKCTYVDSDIDFVLETGEVIVYSVLRKMIDSGELVGGTKVGGVNVISTWTEEAILYSKHIDVVGCFNLCELDITKYSELDSRVANMRLSCAIHTGGNDCDFNDKYPDYINMCGYSLMKSLRSVRRKEGYDFISGTRRNFGTNIVDWLLTNREKVIWLDNNLFGVIRAFGWKDFITVYRGSSKFCLLEII